MAISVQANTAQPPPQNAAQTLAQALRPGQVVEARVVGGGANSTTQVAIGGQLVDAALAVKLQPGTLIQLLVQGAGQSARLTVLLQTTPTPTPVPAQGQPPAPNGAPAAQPQTAPTQSLPQSLPQAPTVQTQAPQPTVNTAPVPAQSQAPSTGQQAPIQTVAANAPLNLISAQTTSATTAPAGAPAQGSVAQGVAAKAQTGQSVPQNAAVAGQGRAVPVAAVPQSVTAPSAPQIEPGTTLRVQISGAGANARPVLVPVATPDGGSAKTQGQTPPQQNHPVLVPNPVQQALTQTVQQSAVRQDSITALLTSLAGFGVKQAGLPKPVAQAGSQVLSGRLNLNTSPLDGAGLRSALTKSGVLFESSLLQGGAKAAPQGDLKSALLNLGNVLKTWLGNSGAEKAVSQKSASPPPPTPHSSPRADRPVSLPLMSAAPNTETPAKLLGQNEAALARMRLVQISSLPEAAARPGQGLSGSAPEMNFELPLMFGGELSVGQFQIFKDGSGGADGEQNGEWKMRFSINFSQTGEVGATVSLRGGKTGVMLWAEREETSVILTQMIGELADSLSARGLEPGTIRCRHGHPPQAQKPIGAFMDNSS